MEATYSLLHSTEKEWGDEQVKQRTFTEQQQFYLVTNSFLLGNMELAVVEILIYNLVANSCGLWLGIIGVYSTQ